MNSKKTLIMSFALCGSIAVGSSCGTSGTRSGGANMGPTSSTQSLPTGVDRERQIDREGGGGEGSAGGGGSGSGGGGSGAGSGGSGGGGGGSGGGGGGGGGD